MPRRGLTSDMRRARRVAEIAKLGYWDADFDNNILYHSVGFLFVYGLPEDTLVTRNEQILNMVHPDDSAKVEACYRRIDTEIVDYSVDYRIYRPDGQITYIREIGEVFRNSIGQPVGHTGTSQDVTEERLNSMRLESALAEAEAALTSRDAFLANMSHELRTPLNAIGGYAEMLDRRDDLSIGQDKAKSYIAAIIQSSNHLKSIIGDILFHVEMDRHALQPSVEEVEVGAFLEEVVNISGLRIDPNKDRIAIDIQPQGATAVFDRRLMSQVLINTIGNAVKYAGTENGLKIGFRSKNGGFRFFVQDRGEGMAAAEVEQATEPFFRGIKAKREAIPGTGLGLALSKQIMELHGGAIELTSVPGQGTRVELIVKKPLAPLD